MKALELLLLNGYEIQMKGGKKTSLPFILSLWKDDECIESSDYCYNYSQIKEVLNLWANMHT